MTPAVLDNPIWESLVNRHTGIALRDGEVARFPPDVAPFLGVAGEGIAAADAIARLLAAPGAAANPDNHVFLLGPTPRLGAGWQLQRAAMLVQMVCAACVPEVDGPTIVPLGPAHRDDVLALAARVYPHYFRPRTMSLGRYFGIYREGRLAAMIGERMGMDGWQEISAVCTDPAFNGRGYARRLLVWLSNDNLTRGRTPFLHVSPDNARALAVYERNGYVTRRRIPFWSLRHA